MPRIDVWDVLTEPPEEQEPLWVGFTRAKLADRYDVGKQLGQGGFGSVHVVVERGSGKEYACKSITKRLNVPNVGNAKQDQHLENIRREALILRRLRGTLNVVFLEDVFEDKDAVHLVMEWCKGGELLQRINTRHYSERTAASYMRAVLRTLAQCHHLRILHRDIKPGNFMLLTDTDKAPVKAIDFGLGVFFDPKKLPRKDLGLEGTPHFMAPEQLSGRTEPASDIWSAGIMAYQLLCGFVPFDDHKNPRAPSLSLVWRAILTEEPKFTNRAWEGVSEEAKDFVRLLLNKDPAKRPTAKQALAHPWLQGKSDQRTQGAPLARTVVQRLQKFGVENALKRTVLDMIANDLINSHMEQLNKLNQEHVQLEAANAPPPPQQQETLRLARNGSSGRAPSEVGEATPEGAAAAASAGLPLLPPVVPGADGAPNAIGGRLRQLAAQDLLLRSAGSMASMPKHATVHAGGDALAALRRGQQLTGLPLSRPLPGVGAPPQGLLASAFSALQQQQQQQPNQRRRSHDLEKRPLRRAVTSIAPGDDSGTDVQAWRQQQQEHQSEPRQEQGPMDLKMSAVAAVAVPAASAGRPCPLPRIQGLSSVLLPQSPSVQNRLSQRIGSPRSSSNGQGAAGPPASAPAGSASGAAAASGSVYKGPVKDLAAATAWDMSFMKNRLAIEGSGHALQHYAWLLNVGERSLHGVLERSFHAGRHHSPAAEAILGTSETAAGQQQQQQQQQPALGATLAVVGSPAASLSLPRRGLTTHVLPGGSAQTAVAAMGGGSPTTTGAGSEVLTVGNPDYIRMLSLVARQRAEHRKYQRLLLDTSGHRQTQYAELVAGEAVDGGPALGRLDDISPPQEADEDEDKAAVGGSDKPAASADTTGTFSLPPPCGSAPAFPTATSLPLPGADILPSSQALQVQPQQALVRKSPISGASAAGTTAAAAAPALAGSHPPSPLAAAAVRTNMTATSSLKQLKPKISGLEEAEALSHASVSVLGTATAAAGIVRGSSFCRTSHASSVLPAGEDGADGGEGSVAEWDDDGLAERVSGSGLAAGAAAGDSGKRHTLLRKVRKALMNPVKTLLGSKQGSSAHGVGADGKSSAYQSAVGTGASTPLRGGPAAGGLLAKLSPSPGAVCSTGALAAVSVSSTATASADERGRGRGAYAAFLQFGGGTGTTTPQEHSSHNGRERSGRGGSGSNEGNTNNNDRSSHSDRSGHVGRDLRAASATHLPGPGGYAIHTVKAHKLPQQQLPSPAAPPAPPAATSQGPETAAGWLLDGVQEPAVGRAVTGTSPEAAAQGATGASGDQDQDQDKDKGKGTGLSQTDLAPALGLLLGDPAKVAELQEVMQRLQYDKAEELTYEQLSEGLQWLGYRLEPSEVQDLLRQVTVGGNEGLTASQFIASQVDWRTFQANHRAEWLDCLRKAFEGLGGGSGPDGRVSLDQLMAALHEKLPEEEVNLAVQESLMDAAVEADAVDFDAFVRLMRCNSNDSLASAGSSELSYDLYDPRLKDSSLHGPLGDGSHYHPALETVPDDPE
ncbi:hypothetical protein Vafri_1520 [Volvox africanus]|nr:hypothetical protein Vafri_1520 [Volvox africanus]